MLRSVAQNNPMTAKLRKRFVAGEDAEIALETAEAFWDQGFDFSLWHLNPDVKQREAVERHVEASIEAIDVLAEAGMGLTVTTGLGELGAQIDEAWARENLASIAKRYQMALGRQDLREEEAARLAAAQGPGAQPPEAEPEEVGRRNLLMLDVRGTETLDAAMAAHTVLTRDGISAGMTVQACFKRSQKDMMALISERAAIRLTVGEVTNPQVRAYRDPKKLDANFMKLAALLLSEEARINNVYPIFAVQDGHYVKAIENLMSDEVWEAGSYEFEMPLGVRDNIRTKIADRGHRVRVLMPFGRNWLPYVADLAAKS